MFGTKDAKPASPMGGMGMMLKTLGLNPDEIVQTISEMGKGVVETRAAILRIETEQAEQSRLLRLLCEKAGIMFEHEFPAQPSKEIENGQ